MSKNRLYERATPSTGFYNGITSGTEPNMRQELINTFDGLYPEIAKAQNGLLRRMRRDTNYNRIPCGCVDTVTQEPDKDRYCGICLGEGFLWDEESIQFYRTLDDNPRDELTKPGLINIPYVIFYIRYDSDITKDDKIVRLVLDTAGDVVLPKRRSSIYRIELVWDFRADNGKLEYWKVYSHLEDVKYLNTPTYNNV